MAKSAHTGLLLRLYLALTRIGASFARRHLRRRLVRGKEDPVRIAEKEGIASQPRPDGPLIWLHAVGVGEVLALPGLARALRDEHPEVQVLITSSSRTSAEALAPNLPAGVIHQYLPLDISAWRKCFLDHWRPTLSVWAERDIWPGFIHEIYRRGIPLALVNGRMDQASFQSKSRVKSLFRKLYGRFSLVEVQDEATAKHLMALGAPKPEVTGSLKTAAAPLADQPEARAKIEKTLENRPVWIAASTHPGEEDIIARAHRLLLEQSPKACLILAPRDPVRALESARILTDAGLDTVILPDTNIPPRQAEAYVIARIGQLGLWYRVASVAFVGGSLTNIGGHNPWEPARLDAAILHGPHIQNFAADYAALSTEQAACKVTDATNLAQALSNPSTLDMRPRAAALAAQNAALPTDMARRLLKLIGAQ